MTSGLVPKENWFSLHPSASSNDYLVSALIFKLDLIFFLTRMQMVKHHYIMVGTGSFHYRNETCFYIEGFL